MNIPVDNNPRNFDHVVRRPVVLDVHYHPQRMVNGVMRRRCRHCPLSVTIGRLYNHLLECDGPAATWTEMSLRRTVELVAQGALGNENQQEVVEIMHQFLDQPLTRLQILRDAGLLHRNVNEDAIRNVFRAPPVPIPWDNRLKWLGVMSIAFAVTFIILAIGLAFVVGRNSQQPDCEHDSFLVPGLYGGTTVALLAGGRFSASIKQARDEVVFNLFQNGNMTGSYKFGDEGLSKALNPSNELMTILHGFNSHAERFADPFSKAFASLDYDLIVIDWKEQAIAPFYLTAKRNVPVVGKVVAEVLNDLIQKKKAAPGKIHVVCHSLGCAVANYIALEVQGKIKRISGLDPAGPFFGNANIREKLDPSDAEFVDVLHTNAGSLLDFKLGMVEDSGHVDFRPNGGSDQPGCEKESWGVCSHSRAIELFLESVTNPDAFESFNCSSFVDFQRGVYLTPKPTNMGMWASNLSRGNYYLETNASPPFNKPNKESSWLARNLL